MCMLQQSRMRTPQPRPSILQPLGDDRARSRPEFMFFRISISRILTSEQLGPGGNKEEEWCVPVGMHDPR